jgi:hypothetical protein
MNKIKKVLTPSGKCIIIQAEVVQCRQCHKVLGFWSGKHNVKRCVTVNEKE